MADKRKWHHSIGNGSVEGIASQGNAKRQKQTQQPRIGPAASNRRQATSRNPNARKENPSAKAANATAPLRREAATPEPPPGLSKRQRKRWRVRRLKEAVLPQNSQSQAPRTHRNASAPANPHREATPEPPSGLSEAQREGWRMGWRAAKLPQGSRSQATSTQHQQSNFSDERDVPASTSRRFHGHADRSLVARTVTTHLVSRPVKRWIETRDSTSISVVGADVGASSVSSSDQDADQRAAQSETPQGNDEQVSTLIGLELAASGATTPDLHIPDGISGNGRPSARPWVPAQDRTDDESNDARPSKMSTSSGPDQHISRSIATPQVEEILPILAAGATPPGIEDHNAIEIDDEERSVSSASARSYQRHLKGIDTATVGETAETVLAGTASSAINDPNDSDSEDDGSSVSGILAPSHQSPAENMGTAKGQEVASADSKPIASSSLRDSLKSFPRIFGAPGISRTSFSPKAANNPPFSIEDDVQRRFKLFTAAVRGNAGSSSEDEENSETSSDESEQLAAKSMDVMSASRNDASEHTAHSKRQVENEDQAVASFEPSSLTAADSSQIDEQMADEHPNNDEAVLIGNPMAASEDAETAICAESQPPEPSSPASDDKSSNTVIDEPNNTAVDEEPKGIGLDAELGDTTVGAKVNNGAIYEGTNNAALDEGLGSQNARNGDERRASTSQQSRRANVGVKRQSAFHGIGLNCAEAGRDLDQVAHKSDDGKGSLHQLSCSDDDDKIQRAIDDVAKDVFESTRPLPPSKQRRQTDDEEESSLINSPSVRGLRMSMRRPRMINGNMLPEAVMAPEAEVIICHSVHIPESGQHQTDNSRGIIPDDSSTVVLSSPISRMLEADSSTVVLSSPVSKIHEGDSSTVVLSSSSSKIHDGDSSTVVLSSPVSKMRTDDSKPKLELRRSESSSSLSDLSRTPSPPPEFDDVTASSATSQRDEESAEERGLTSTTKRISAKKRKMTGMTSTHFTPIKRARCKNRAATPTKEANANDEDESQVAEAADDGPAVTRRTRSSEARNTARPKRKSTGKKSEHFLPLHLLDRVDLPTLEKRGQVPPGTSTAPVLPITSERFGIIQEKLWDQPFWLLVAVTFLNKTAGRAAAPTFWALKDRYPTPKALAAADQTELHDMIHHLGLQTQRSKRLIKISQAWIDNPPVAGRRFRTLHYPAQGDGKGYKRDEVVDEDAGECEGALEIGHIPGCGPYAWDSWRMFCRDVLRGVAQDYNGKGTTSKDFVPEWQRVLPLDKELRATLRWMWLRDGWIWNHESGEKRRATDEEMDKALRGEMEVPDAAEKKFAAQAAGVEVQEGVAVTDPEGSDGVVESSGIAPLEKDAVKDRTPETAEVGEVGDITVPSPSPKRKPTRRSLRRSAIE